MVLSFGFRAQGLCRTTDIHLSLVTCLLSPAYDTPGGVDCFESSPLAFSQQLCYTVHSKGEICGNADFRILGDNYSTSRRQSQVTLTVFLRPRRPEGSGRAAALCPPAGVRALPSIPPPGHGPEAQPTWVSCASAVFPERCFLLSQITFAGFAAGLSKGSRTGHPLRIGLFLPRYGFAAEPPA